MEKLTNGAEPYTLAETHIEQVGDNEWAWGTLGLHHFTGQPVVEVEYGRGKFKSEEAAHKKMVYEMNRNPEQIKLANHYYRQSISYER